MYHQITMTGLRKSNKFTQIPSSINTKPLFINSTAVPVSCWKKNKIAGTSEYGGACDSLFFCHLSGAWWLAQLSHMWVGGESSAPCDLPLGLLGAYTVPLFISSRSSKKQQGSTEQVSMCCWGLGAAFRAHQHSFQNWINSSRFQEGIRNHLCVCPKVYSCVKMQTCSILLQSTGRHHHTAAQRTMLLYADRNKVSVCALQIKL